MSKTRHIQQRMSQRGIKQTMIELVIEYGKSQGNKVILNRKATDCVLQELERVKKNVLKIREKGGLVVVDINNSLITTYSLDSYKRKDY